MTPLQTALRLLALITALFLIFLIIWLFYCRCRRGAVEPTAAPGQVYYAVVQPHGTNHPLGC